MNSISVVSPLMQPLVSRVETRLPAFRLPQHMHVPAKLIAIDFSLQPDWAWIPRSFVAWLHPPLTPVPPWML